ncbi:MAG TPA: hypothetical protein PKO06_03890 [Candidatus Ozemobacteraceae bacterium]|nr:hypothetical protein [Candidatus Ozemobacteraceae bacterium]
MSTQSRFSELKYALTLLFVAPIILGVVLIAACAFDAIPLSIMIRLGMVNITSTSNESATRSIMNQLKNALICYHADIGRWPHVRSQISSETMALADTYCLYDTVSRNVLFNSRVGYPFESNGLTTESYQKRWKGPYLDGTPEECMRDAWEKRIRFELNGTPPSGPDTGRTKKLSILYLHSAGSDGLFDPLSKAVDPAYAGDDIIMQVARTKVPFE